MLDVVGGCAMLENDFDAGYAPRPDSRPLTRFESRGQRLGHEVWDLCFRKP
jgi:tRNA (guanine-N7-)-methyltransferase